MVLRLDNLPHVLGHFIEGLLVHAKTMRVTMNGPCEESEAFEKLPVKQETGLTGLEADRQMRDLLGADFTKLFTMVKRFEPERLSAQVTGWKRSECPEMI